MSSNLPPTGPPAGPPYGPPYGPPPPRPEYLENPGGQRAPRRPAKRSGARRAVMAGGAVVGLGAATAAVWGAVWYFGNGPQPAEALPASTVGYLSVDIDPSGEQLLEARQALEKFPAWQDQEIGSQQDLREALFEEIQQEAQCEDLDYGDDIEPWLGDRLALAAVDLGEDNPATVFVVEVEEAAAAEDGLQAIADCAAASGGSEGSEDVGGWVVSEDWAVIAETEEIAQDVVDEAEQDPLSDDEDFGRWTDEAGGPGILTAYAAPEAAQYLAEGLDGLFSTSVDGVCASTTPDGEVDPYPADCVEEDPDVPPELESLLEDFEGAAITVRFDDGALEVESASSIDLLGFDALASSDNGDEVMTTLPDDTAAAFGVGFEPGWFEDAVEYVDRFSGGEVDVDQMIADAEAASGLDLPEDAETLAGESAVIALGSDFDPAAFESEEVPSDMPIGVKIKGDPEAIQGVIEKIIDTGQLEEGDAELLASDSEGDYIAVGPDEDYRQEILEGGDLGGTETYQDVVGETGSAAIVFYLDFDAGDDWLAGSVDDEELRENLEPLSAVGISGWEDDGVAHSVLRVSTD